MQQKQEQGSIFEETILKMNPLVSDYASDQPMANNREILRSIDQLRASLQRHKLGASPLDDKGREIAEAVDQFLRTSESLIREKNPDQAMQRFVQRCIEFGERARQEAKPQEMMAGLKQNIGPSRISELPTHLRRLVQHSFTSSDTRKMMREVEMVFEKVYDLSKKARNEGKPLSQIGKEEREQIMRSLLNLYSKMGSTPEWKEMRGDIMAIYDYSISKKDTISPQLQRDFASLMNEALELVNRFSEVDLFQVRKKLEETYNCVEKDPEAKQFFDSMRTWTDFIVEHPDSSNDEKTIKEGSELIDRGMNVFQKYQNELSSASEEIKRVVRSLQSDKFVNRYKENITQVGRSLKGSYLDTIVQLRTLLAPMIRDSLKEIPLPRVYSSDSSTSWALDNMKLYGKESFLDDIIVNFEIGLKDIIEVSLTIRRVEISLKGIDFEYNRTSMPAISDKGKADVRIYTPGWRLKWTVNQQRGREPFFELADISGRVKDLDISITEAQHSVIDAIVIKLWTPSLKRKIESAIEKVLIEKAGPLTEKLNTFFASENAAQLSKMKVEETFGDKLHQKSGPTVHTEYGETRPVVEKKLQ